VPIDANGSTASEGFSLDAYHDFLITMKHTGSLTLSPHKLVGADLNTVAELRHSLNWRRFNLIHFDLENRAPPDVPEN
jgi:hypothetical protein